jgi:tyrosine-protein kinase Etk/Wzc
MNQSENPLEFMKVDGDGFNVREEVEKYLHYWKWFLLGIILALGAAYFDLRYTPNQYEVSATILFDDESSGGMSSELAAFEELGIMGAGKKNIQDEIGILKSRSLIERVVRKLDLNISYSFEGRVLTSEVHKNTLPFKVTFFVRDSTFYKSYKTFRIQVVSDTAFRILDEEKIVISEHLFGENISGEFGDMTVTPLGSFADNKDLVYIVNVSPVRSVAKTFQKAIQVNLLFKNSNILELILRGPIKLKSEEILNELIQQYNNDAIEYKSLIGRNTREFINERLIVIEEDLSKVDSNVEEFKSTNKLTDIESEAALIVANNSELEKKIIELSTRMKLVDYIATHINKNSEQLIPENLGIGEGDISAGSSQYNGVLIERNRIVQSTGIKNPVIINLDAQLNQLRKSILQGLVNLKSSLEISLAEAMSEQRKMSARITSAPGQEREFRDIQRQQSIIETLYLFLLEKREENAISLAVTTPNAKLIDAADGSDLPVYPNRETKYITALFIGICIPFVIIYFIFLLDNKIHTRKELELIVKAPFLGDIPKTTNDTKVLLKEDRSSVAEAFRMLRTNMNFMLGGNSSKKSKAVYITSTIPGEGKTFIAINLATVLAISNKKVLLVGADIRKPKVAEYLNVPSLKKGLSLFLTDDRIQVSEIIETIKETKFDMIQSGIVPPNPSELLMNGRFDEVMAYGKQHYDYVIVDTAPINMVTDTLQLAEKADLFLFVVRANYLDKRLLEIPKKLYSEKRLPNMAMIMNGSDATKGYGYGYGYGYGEIDKKKSWFSSKS